MEVLNVHFITSAPANVYPALEHVAIQVWIVRLSDCDAKCGIARTNLSL